MSALSQMLFAAVFLGSPLALARTAATPASASALANAPKRVVFLSMPPMTGGRFKGLFPVTRGSLFGAPTSPHVGFFDAPRSQPRPQAPDTHGATPAPTSLPSRPTR